MKRFRVALLANLKNNAPKYEGMSIDRWDDLDSESTIEAIRDGIRQGGHECEYFEGNLGLIESLPRYKPDICFNICEGHFGDSREAHVPVLLEMLQIPYTGSRVLTLALSLDKPMTKRVLHYHELPTPAFQVFERANEPVNDDISYPLFVKPSREGTGMGISAKSIVRNEAELREQVAYIISKYQQSALVESYIEGREVTVGVVGNLRAPVALRLPDDEDAPRMLAGLDFLPPMEVNLKPFNDSDVVYSNRLKVDLADQLEYICPADLSPTMIEDLNWLTAAVFRVTGAFDVSRVDFRLDAHNHWKPYILEINPLPGLAPGISDLVIEAAAIGIDHAGLVNLILEAALKRYELI